MKVLEVDKPCFSADGDLSGAMFVITGSFTLLFPE